VIDGLMEGAALPFKKSLLDQFTAIKAIRDLPLFKSFGLL